VTISTRTTDRSHFLIFAELSEDRKQLDVDLKREGHRNCEIVKLLHIPESTIRSIWKKYNSTGNVDNIPRVGRPRNVTRRGEVRLLRTVKKNRGKVLRENTNAFNEGGVVRHVFICKHVADDLKITSHIWGTFKRVTQDSLKLCSSFYYNENRRVFKMGRKSKELSEDRKQLVVDLKREGHRNCEIVKLLHIPESTIPIAAIFLFSRILMRQHCTFTGQNFSAVRYFSIYFI
jgi:transposase